ncbi:MAG TPA: hypothetical protein VHH36_06395 [Candidatus Thermoplasmatota archaeon]|nr:hypothetical protein [Candidatus Thermoplasmatota archaeon]
MRRALVLALASATLAPLAAAIPPPLTDEAPRDWTCDAEVRVCAGAETGGDASCATSAAGVANCTWTYGWLTRAWSEGPEAGSEAHAFSAVVESCSSVHGCAVVQTSAASSGCAWAAVGACDDGQGPYSGAAERALQMGECLTLRIALRVEVDARAEGPLAPLLPDPVEVSYVVAREAGASTCRVDDGR